MRRVMFLGMIVLIVNSCGVLRPKPTSDIKVANAKDLIEQIQTIQPSWNTLDYAWIGHSTSRRCKSANHDQHSNSHKRIDLGHAAMIVPVGRAKIDKTGVSFYEQIGKNFFEGDFQQLKMLSVFR